MSLFGTPPEPWFEPSEYVYCAACGDQTPIDDLDDRHDIYLCRDCQKNQGETY